MQKFQTAITSPTGDVIPNAVITVVTSTGAAATIYAADGTSPYPTNQISTDSQGEFSFYAANGRYSYTVAATNYATETYTDFLLFDPADGTTQGSTVISVDSAADALRITQLGSGNALVVEDEANPDSSRFQIDSTGRVSIGTATHGVSNLRISRTVTGGTAGANVYSDWTVASDVTGAVSSYRSEVTTASSTFTLGFLVHYTVQGLTVGAGSTVTDQRGINIGAATVGATSNYGLYSAIPAGTNNWNIYAPGTASNYMVGALGIGATGLTGFNLTIARQLTGAVTGISVRNVFTVASDVTTAVYAYQSQITTQAAAFTIPNVYNYVAENLSLGAGSSVTSQYGFVVSSGFTVATNNFGFRADIPSGANRWNFYSAGTANNAFAGNSRFGSTTAPVAVVDVTGNVAATTSILSTGATSGVGYATGAGGAVTQLTSRVTGVTLNNVSGAITLVSTAGSAAYQTFTVTNSAVAATDVVIVSQKSGTDKYITLVTNVAAGSFQITFATTGGTTTEQPVFNFAVIKAVAA